MGQRRKHMLQSAITQDVQPPGNNQHIVKALGSRGGNIVEVQYPSGATTLCMMPARFNRKLWVRRGGFLIIEASPEAELDAGSRVTGTIATVLYDEHIKQLRKQPGIWPPEFAPADVAAAAGAAADGEDLEVPEDGSSGSGSGSGSEEGSRDGPVGSSGAGISATAGPGSSGPAAAATAAAAPAAAAGGQAGKPGEGPAGAAGGGGAAAAAEEEEEQDDSDGSLPPLQQINNRRVVHHYVSDDSDDDAED